MKRIIYAVAATLSIIPAISQAADSWIGKDKGMHVLAGSLISGSILQTTNSHALALELGVAAAIGKEITDIYRPKHVASFRDATATIIGSLVSVQTPGLLITPISIYYFASW